MKIDFDNIFDDYIDGSQKEWSHDRSSTLGASEVFDCIRKQWFNKRWDDHEFEEDADYNETWGAMRRGDLIENFHFVPALEGFLPKPMVIIMHGEDQDTLVQGLNSATPDGLILNCTKDALENYGIDDIESDCVMIECKSIDPRADLKSEKEIHHGQAQVQLGMVREQTEHKPMYSVILYINASFLNVMTPFIVKYDGSIYKAAKGRAKQVFNQDDPAKMMPEGKFSGACQYCPFKSACAQVSCDSIPDKSNKPELDPYDFVEMNQAVTEYARILNEKKEAEEEYERAKEEIKRILLDKNTSRIAGDSYKVAWSKVNGRRFLDKKKMEASGLDPDDYLTEGNPYDRLTVTLAD